MTRPANRRFFVFLICALQTLHVNLSLGDEVAVADIQSLWKARAMQAAVTSKKLLKIFKEKPDTLTPKQVCVALLENAFANLLDERVAASQITIEKGKQNYSLHLFTEKKGDRHVVVAGIQFAYAPGDSLPTYLAAFELRKGWSAGISAEGPGKLVVMDGQGCGFVFSLSDPLNPTAASLKK